jgi:hypothetical protein
MENHRLTTMKDGYPHLLFNKLYEETKQLRKSLAWGIDHRRYGVDKDLIESWFDDKFIFVFNKHCLDKDENVLKGFIISSLQQFKNRVLRGAYSKKNEFYTNSIQLEGEHNIINYIIDKQDTPTSEIFYGLVLEYFKKELNSDAYTLLELELNPPPYILNRIPKSNSKIPVSLVLEFFDLVNNNKNIKYIRQLRKDILLATEKARQELNPNLAF